jgi:uncharacterized protein YdaU (DUF1376 family)
MAAKKVRYIPFEIEAFLADTDFQFMNARQRGAYLSLILYMYANDGKCSLDMQQLKKITKCRNIEKVWQKIKKKFQLKEGQFTHKRVTSELRKAKRLMQAKRKGGLTTAKKKKQSCSTPISTAFKLVMANKNKNNNENRREDERDETGETREEITSETNTDSRLCDSRSSTPLRTKSGESFKMKGIRFYDALCSLIPPKDQSDRTSFNKMSKWLVAQCEMGKFNEEIFKRAFDYANEARKGRKPAAVFTTLMKRELNYEP